MTSGPRDPEHYGWVVPGWKTLYSAGYCASLVENTDPARLLTQLNAVQLDRLVGWNAVRELATFDPAHHDRPFGTKMAAAKIDEAWTLVIECGYPVLAAGATASLISQRSQVIGHYRAPGGSGLRFQWFRNGRKELSFNPCSPWHRSGAVTSDYEYLIADIGLPIDEAEPLPSSDEITQAGFAFCELLSGFRLNSATFGNAEFQMAGRSVSPAL